MGAPDVAAALRRGPDTATEVPLRILFLHPKTLVDSWPVPVDTLGEIVKFPSATCPVLAAAIRDLSVEMRMLDGYVGRIPFRDYKRSWHGRISSRFRACRLSRRWTPN
jgi:anaerobic magnesium-protoporphyrin IX monomethyl ester cyclase